ncbi:MAG: CerR family C-terminal domain-containing protein [Pseudomonadota bacterium]
MMEDSPRAPEDTSTDAVRPVRADGEQSRERLRQAALVLFAQQGFSKTSTREIAEAAQTNVAAISYYFGDKAGLYRAVFAAPRDDIGVLLNHLADAALPLEQALKAVLRGFIEPLREGDMARHCMKLHMREMLEPTGLWEEEIRDGIAPQHAALVRVLSLHLGLARADDEVHRLAISIAGLGVHLHVGHEVIEVLAPRLNRGARALDDWSDRLVMYALAMVEAERLRRAQQAPAVRGAARRAGVKGSKTP